MTIAEALVMAGLASSRGEARRLAGQGGVAADDVKITDVDVLVPAEWGHVILRVGVRRIAAVDFSGTDAVGDMP